MTPRLDATRPRSGILVEEMTFGKLSSVKSEPPEDLHVTSRSRGIDDVMQAALQPNALFGNNVLNASRIDPKSAADGLFLIRPLDSEKGVATHLALSRVCLRDYISANLSRRTYPQLVASVVRLDDFRRAPDVVLEFAAGKKAERVSMDGAVEERLGFAPRHFPTAVTRPTPVTDEEIQIMAPMLKVLVRDRYQEAPTNTTITFGENDFPDEAGFLAAFGRALQQRVDLVALKQLSVVVGFAGDFAGNVLRYMPSQKSDPVRLPSAEMLRARGWVSMVSIPARSQAAFGSRASEIIARAPDLDARMSMLRRAFPIPAERPAEVASQNSIAQPLSETHTHQRLCADHLIAYRRDPTKTNADLLYSLAQDYLQDDISLGDEFDYSKKAAWQSLLQYTSTPPTNAMLGMLFDGALFHHDRTGEGEPDSVAQSWLVALNEKLHTSAIILTGQELDTFNRTTLWKRLARLRNGYKAQEVWRDSLAALHGDSEEDHRSTVQMRFEKIQQAQHAGSNALGLRGIVHTDLDVLV